MKLSSSPSASAALLGSLLVACVKPVPSPEKPLPPTSRPIQPRPQFRPEIPLPADAAQCEKLGMEFNLQVLTRPEIYCDPPQLDVDLARLRLQCDPTISKKSGEVIANAIREKCGKFLGRPCEALIEEVNREAQKVIYQDQCGEESRGNLKELVLRMQAACAKVKDAGYLLTYGHRAGWAEQMAGLADIACRARVIEQPLPPQPRPQPRDRSLRGK